MMTIIVPDKFICVTQLNQGNGSEKIADHPVTPAVVLGYILATIKNNWQGLFYRIGATLSV
ncbi:MAG: hypothetical protein ACOYL3_26725 [Desulfuromonadaceae bacterium]